MLQAVVPAKNAGATETSRKDAAGSVELSKRKDEMTAREYFLECEKADWYYMMADDFRSWSAGEERMRKLESMAEDDEEFTEILDKWKLFMYSGEAFGKGDGKTYSRPILEDYV